ncbi:hypothetical protein QVZ41_09465 [Wenyingzhuangia sp. chi5]|uniref:Uncharacterized protein n=1 Tax=Wenyingzhuangia gilva TaxID=3057677 RepID=A0ABT8VSW7_9FLAO|nr:hypothetical protein [Wenyingzhuangia sp. chi5]MDO3695070.1 hypothetical protein [Wenyingzhuangia sp. chi5]
MAITFLSSFILSLAKAGIWISFGILIYKHHDFLLLLITNKLIPDHETPLKKKEDIHKIIKWIGICIIVTGIVTALASSLPIIMSLI